MKFYVTLASIHDETIFAEVIADYQQIQDGHLIFRNRSRGNDYPEMVVAYAPGHWLDVIGNPDAIRYCRDKKASE